MSRFGSRSGPSNPGSKPPEPAPKAESLSTEVSPIKREQAPPPPPPSESDVADVDPEVHALLTAWLAEEAKKGVWQKLKAEEAWADWKRRVDQMDLDAAEKEWAAEIGNLKHLEGQEKDAYGEPRPGIASQIRVVRARIGVLEDRIKALRSRR